MKHLFKLLAPAALALGGLTTSFAQASFSFSLTETGLLRATLLAPLEFTIVNTPTTHGAAFVFDGVGNPLNNGGNGAGSTGTITFSVNNGPSMPLDWIGNGITYGLVTPDDLYFLSSPFFSPANVLQVGDVVRLSAGEMISGTQALFIPASGIFTADIFDNNAVLLSTGSVISGPAVPEPGTSAALAGLAILGFAASRRRR
jgi:hypothetical protein